MDTVFNLSCKQPDPARWSTNFANFTDSAELSLELRMIFRTVEWTGDTG